jgi:DNA-binding PadR family transcriptional regulator
VTLTPLAVACLAVLAEEPMHPYQVFSLLRDRREDHLVKVRPGSLYHTVERLARDGLAQPCGTEREGNRPERTTYAITPAGRRALTERIGAMLDAPVNEYPQFPLALSESHNLPLAQVVEQLTHRVERLDELLDETGATLDAVRERRVPEAYWFVTDYLRTLQIVERDWIRNLINRLENGDVPWPYKTENR